MPTYAYRCTTCEHRFEQFQRMADDPLTECPVCQSLVKRVIHPVGVVFKGSGWYITDSRKTSSDNGTSDKKPETTGEKPAETAKAAKTETTKSSETAGTEAKSTASGKPLAAD
ncbi:MAG: hypothetical protein M3Q03_03910 [Chloroflexota bacterium]|nr:hypothetical protein [Chloroflexota bacterium]